MHTTQILRILNFPLCYIYLIATYQQSSSDGFTTFLKIAAFSNLYVFLVPK